MKAMNRVLLVAALAALAVFVFAAPAAAFDGGFNGTETSLGEEMCEDILQASVDAVDGWHEFIAVGFSDKECKKTCKAVRRTCDKAVKTREACFTRMDRIQNDAMKALCGLLETKDAREICKDGVKSEHNDNKDEIDVAVEIERDDCEDVQDACLLQCPGILFD